MDGVIVQVWFLRLPAMETDNIT